MVVLDTGAQFQTFFFVVETGLYDSFLDRLVGWKYWDRTWLFCLGNLSVMPLHLLIVKFAGKKHLNISIDCFLPKNREETFLHLKAGEAVCWRDGSQVTSNSYSPENLV